MGAQHSTSQQGDTSSSKPTCSMFRRHSSSELITPIPRENSVPDLLAEQCEDEVFVHPKQIHKPPNEPSTVQSHQPFLRERKSALNNDISGLYTKLNLSDNPPAKKMQAWSTTSIADDIDSRLNFPQTVKRETSSIDLSDVESQETDDSASINDEGTQSSLFGEKLVPGRTSRLSYTRTGPTKSRYVDLQNGSKIMAIDFLTEELFPVGAESKIITEESGVDDVQWVKGQYVNERADLSVVGSGYQTQSSSAFQMHIINTIFEANQPLEPSDISDIEDNTEEAVRKDTNEIDDISNYGQENWSNRTRASQGGMAKSTLESTTSYTTNEQPVTSVTITRSNSFLKSRRSTRANKSNAPGSEGRLSELKTIQDQQDAQGVEEPVASTSWQRKSIKIVPKSPQAENNAASNNLEDSSSNFRQRLKQGRHSPGLRRSLKGNLQSDTKMADSSSTNTTNSQATSVTVHTDTFSRNNYRSTYFKVKSEPKRAFSPIPEKDTPRTGTTSPVGPSFTPRESSTTESGYSSPGSRSHTPEDSPMRLKQTSSNVPVPGSITPTIEQYKEIHVVKKSEKSRDLKRIETVCIHDLPDDETDRPFRNQSQQIVREPSEKSKNKSNFARTESSWRSSFFRSKRSKVKEISEESKFKRSSSLRMRGPQGCSNISSLFSACTKGADDPKTAPTIEEASSSKALGNTNRRSLRDSKRNKTNLQTD